MVQTGIGWVVVYYCFPLRAYGCYWYLVYSYHSLCILQWGRGVRHQTGREASRANLRRRQLIFRQEGQEESARSQHKQSQSSCSRRKQWAQG